jgi:hypothetical protein
MAGEMASTYSRIASAKPRAWAAQALEVGPLLGGMCLLVDVARRPCRFVPSHEARASILSLREGM